MCIVKIFILNFSAYFWYRETLNISPDVETPEEVNWVIGEYLADCYKQITINMIIIFSFLFGTKLGLGVPGYGERNYRES